MQVTAQGQAQVHGFRTDQTINMAYVDGVSITHGNPRSHIWTFAADRDEAFKDCPYEAGSESAPPFVEDNYYCESGYNDTEYPCIQGVIHQ